MLLSGDCATDERFQRIVREVVDQKLNNKPEIYEMEPVYSAARGAAEMAKRVWWMYNQTHPNTEDFGNDL
jgi:hypothetical protein